MREHMTIDKLINELQTLKDRGMKGHTPVYVHDGDHSGNLKANFTVRVDGEGDVIVE